MEPYYELEHIRWMRHHDYYNWTYDPQRNDAARKHHLLLPYHELPEEQKPKDRDAYDVIPELAQMIFQTFQ